MTHVHCTCRAVGTGVGGQGHVPGDGAPSHFFYVCYQARPELELNRSPSEATGRGVV